MAHQVLLASIEEQQVFAYQKTIGITHNFLPNDMDLEKVWANNIVLSKYYEQ